MYLLIMESDDEIRGELVQELKQKGHIVESETDGLKAWEHFHFNMNLFDALLINAKMPRLTGIELLRRIREQGKSLPVIMSCNYGRLERVLPGLELNIHSVLPLPYRTAQLDKVLAKLENKQPSNWKELLVRVMNLTLQFWKKEGMDLESLVRHSGIWDMKSTGKKKRYYNPQIYCRIETLPRHIHWEKVLASADFVIRQCEISLERISLQILRIECSKQIHTVGQDSISNSFSRTHLLYQ